MPRGAPDWSRNVNLYGFDGTALRVVRVDPNGQFYTLIRGHDGTTYRDIRVDTTGQLYTLVRGYDGTTYRDVKVDAEGRMMAMLNALHNTTPTPLKCDAAGNIQIDLKTQTLDRVSTITKAPTGTTPVFKSGVAAGVITVLHTVTTGKTFYLTYANLATCVYDTAFWAYLAARDTADIIRFYIARMRVRGGSDEYGYPRPVNLSIPVNLSPPYPIPEGWDITLYSQSSKLDAAAVISGWEE